MINLIVVITFFIILIIFEFIKMQDEARIIVDFALVSSLLFYCASSASEVSTSKLFNILGIVVILLIPVTLAIKYTEKISDKKD